MTRRPVAFYPAWTNIFLPAAFGGAGGSLIGMLTTSTDSAVNALETLTFIVSLIIGILAMVVRQRFRKRVMRKYVREGGVEPVLWL